MAAPVSPVLDAALASATCVVGRVQAPRRLDRHGRAAQLVVERALRGGHAPGDELVIAWESLSPSPTLRFDEGQRILAVLEPPPDWSLWRERLGSQAFLLVAERGAAWLEEPSGREIELLEALLGAGDAEKPAGERALAALVAEARPELAHAALAQLAAPGRSADPRIAAALAAVLEDVSRPLGLRRSVLALDAAWLEPMRPRLEKLAAGGALELEALDALARLDGGLAEPTTRALLRRPDPAARVLAVERGARFLSSAVLAELAAHDEAAVVRRAALSALAPRREPQVLTALGGGLFDDDPAVREEAAVRLAARGEEAVPLLERLALERSAPEAGGPVAALALAGPSGRPALKRILEDHDDPGVRSLAAVALGQALSDH